MSMHEDFSPPLRLGRFWIDILRTEMKYSKCGCASISDPIRSALTSGCIRKLAPVSTIDAHKINLIDVRSGLSPHSEPISKFSGITLRIVYMHGEHIQIIEANSPRREGGKTPLSLQVCSRKHILRFSKQLVETPTEISLGYILFERKKFNSPSSVNRVQGKKTPL